MDGPDFPADGNAEFIVTACNNHDRLEKESALLADIMNNRDLEPFEVMSAYGREYAKIGGEK